MKRILLFAFTFFIICVQGLTSRHKNVVIYNVNDPNEPSICINPKNTNQIVAGSNIYNVHHSTDGGKNWSTKNLTSIYGVWGDPIIVCDTNGYFYFSHLSNEPSHWIGRMVCQKSSDAGLIWSDSSSSGYDGISQQDKEGVAVNPINNNIYMAWTNFPKYQSTKPGDSTTILFSKSADQAKTWSKPVRLNFESGDCIDSDNTVEGSTVAVDNNGTIYVAWSIGDSIRMNKSTDDGITWLPHEIKAAYQPGGWDYMVDGINRSNGFPCLATDLSDGPFRGTLYLNWSDELNGAEDKDIWLSKSIDGGKTWSERKRVNDDQPGKQQFLTWMTVDQVTGFIYIVFYDRRNHSDNGTDVYLAVSKDGGETFYNDKISEKPFYPSDAVFFGDYNSISAHNNMVRPIWTRMDGMSTSILTSLVDVDSLSTTIPDFRENIFNTVDLEQNYPNPFITETYISFKMHRNAIINLEIFDYMGNKAATIIDNKNYPTGKYFVRISSSEYHLNSGAYYYILTSDGEVIKKKMVLIR